MSAELAKDKTPLGEARRAFFVLNKGPWDRVDHLRPFVSGAPEKPKGAGFYPLDASKDDLEGLMKANAQAKSFFTVVRRGHGTLGVVPYSSEYKSELERASKELADAASLAKDPTLKSYLEKRAKAFLTDDYYDSDVAWMELDAQIEPTIGPYEVYEDELFNAKAAYESFIGVRDQKESEKLAKFSSQLQDVEDHLPIDPKYRNPKIAALAPIRVINEIYCSGDADHGVQTAAFNLPNDERVIKEKGSKRVMLKNVQEAKFDRVLIPISKVALAPADRKHVAFDSFFTHILMHELMHGLGPHEVSGRPVRERLKETYSAIEEAKADVSGLWAMQFLIDKGVIDKSVESKMYVTYLASSFRAIRFGVDEAHGKGIAVQINFLLDRGAFTIDKGGGFHVDASKIKDGIRELAGVLLTIEAEGSYERASELLSKQANVRPEVKKVLDALAKVPVDIHPRFVTAEMLAK
jgi:hypothetical protein